jgi:signal peptidase
MNSKIIASITFIAVILLFIGPISLISINGSSMYPTVTDGSLQPIYQSQSAEVDDIIVYYSEHTDSVITHRIVESTPEGFITQGDNNAVTDQSVGHEPVSNEDIIGKSINIGEQPIYIPYLGTIFLLLRTNPVWFLALVGGGLLLVSSLLDKARTRSDVGVLTASDIFQPIFITVIITITIIILISSTTLGISFIFTDSDSVASQQNIFSITDENPSEVITIERESTFGTTVYYSPDFTILEVSEKDNITELSVELESQRETGARNTQLYVYTYPPVLPTNILLSLTILSPVLSAFISSILFTAPFYLIYRIFITPHKPIQNPKNRFLNRLYKKYID